MESGKNLENFSRAGVNSVDFRRALRDLPDLALETLLQVWENDGAVTIPEFNAAILNVWDTRNGAETRVPQITMSFVEKREAAVTPSTQVLYEVDRLARNIHSIHENPSKTINDLVPPVTQFKQYLDGVRSAEKRNAVLVSIMSNIDQFLSSKMDLTMFVRLVIEARNDLARNLGYPIADLKVNWPPFGR